MVGVFYSSVLYILSPLVFLHLWLRGRKAPAYRKRWRERLGFYRQSYEPNTIVVHCASVGELMAASKLINTLQQTHSVTITCNTPTGSQEIKTRFSGCSQHLYLPLDFPGATNRFLTALKPSALVILETELWPNLLAKAHKKHIPVCVINARLSEKSFSRYQKVAPLSRQLMSNISVLGAHNQADATRFIKLGLRADKVAITGSLKFDIDIDNATDYKVETLKEQLHQYDFIWVAGSTHPGEHEQVIAAHQALLATNPNALLIIAPRHPEQFEVVATYLNQLAMSFSQRSKNRHQGQSVLLADTMGEMLTFFGAAHCAFIGGSLIDRGGHNPLEPAAFRLPIITGPNFTNFLHVYPKLLDSNACLQVENQAQLATQLINLSNDIAKRTQLGNNAYAILANNRGAVHRALALVKKEVTQ